MPLVLSTLLVGFIALAAAFLAAAWQSPSRAKWLGIASIAAAAPFFFWLGSFAEQFGAGQCYSNAIASVANSVEHTTAPADLAKQIRDLPMHGYETSCPEVEKAAKSLPNAKTP